MLNELKRWKSIFRLHNIEMVDAGVKIYVMWYRKQNVWIFQLQSQRNVCIVPAVQYSLFVRSFACQWFVFWTVGTLIKSKILSDSLGQWKNDSNQVNDKKMNDWATKQERLNETKKMNDDDQISFSSLKPVCEKNRNKQRWRYDKYSLNCEWILKG